MLARASFLSAEKVRRIAAMKSLTGRKVCFVLLTTLLCLFIGATLASGQVTGTILGAVQDQQGAYIPQVQVTAKNTGTSAVRTVTTDESGSYRITNIPAGAYEITASV